MTVKLIVQAEVKGASQVNKLNAGLKSLGTQSLIAKRKLAALTAGAARSRATFAALGTTLKVGVGVGLAAVTFGIGKFVKDTFAAGKLTESLQVRFKLLFNSATEGGKAFQVMNKFAAKVPFSLEAIAAGSGNLAVISKNASELNKILEVTGNVAAATGLDFAQTATQIQRSFAGGIAAADVFRERGVRAMLGFEAGATVSIEETKKRFFEVFANGGQYSQATKEFETTLEANVSFVQDAYFRFRQAAAEPLFGGVKEQLIELVGDFKENDAQLKTLAKRIGKSLARGFKNLGEFIKSTVENINLLVKAIKLFIGLKAYLIIGDLGAAFKLLIIQIKAAEFSMYALGAAFRVNPLGIFITTVQIAAFAWIAFSNEIKEAAKYIKDTFTLIINRADLAVRNFWDSLGLGNDAHTKKILELEAEIKRVEDGWNKASEAKFEYLNNGNSRFDKYDDQIAKRKIYQQPHNPRLDMLKEQADYLKKMAEDYLASEEQYKFGIKKGTYNDEDKARRNRADKFRFQEPVHNIRGDMAAQEKATAIANAAALEAMKEQRAQLASIGIESQAIATTIGDTWVNGLREGNSLLQITKDSFKNVLQMIAETILRKTIEYGVELLFQALLGKKVDKEKEITKEKKKQFFWTALTAGMGGGGGNGGSFLNMAEGGVVPGGAPYTDRIPTMLTPGEVVIPRNKVGQQSSVTNNTINISGNVDQRAIDQIRSVISSSPSHVGGANKNYTRNTSGLRNRGK